MDAVSDGEVAHEEQQLQSRVSGDRTIAPGIASVYVNKPP
jgi:hypothetical protein